MCFLGEIMESKTIDIRCPQCDKLLARMKRTGSCKDMLLYCKWCRKEYQITIKETKKVEPKSQ